MEKMTKAQMFEALKGYVKGEANEAEFVEFLNKQIELATKKRNTLTKAQRENAEIVERIYNYFKEVNKALTIDEIATKFELASGQKASALVKKLVDAGKVTRGKEGKKAIYTLAN